MQYFSPYEILDRKRRGCALDAGEISWFVGRFVAGEVADYQMSALLMAIAIRGMTEAETAALTRTLLESGESWNLRDRYDFVADKHSTGGVGDKVSLVLTPWLAACGVKVAMLSGRGLGHTGGTLDKLETIPGFNARLSRAEIERAIDECGCAIATSTERIAPADRLLYALRDVTATVESLPLITASIMSKKLALGASALVLDIKCGSGAFMKSVDHARELARSLIRAADGSGTRVEALITDMSQPLGNAVGNANEVAESIEAIRGGGPDDLVNVTREQAVRVMAMRGISENDARKQLDDARSSGRVAEAARKWIAAQGGDPAIVDHPERLAQPERAIEVRANRSGWIRSIDTRGVGLLAVDLGAGRRKENDTIDPAAGISLLRKVGAAVRAGDVMARIAPGRGRTTDSVEERYLSLVDIGDAPPELQRLIIESIKG